jgi:outer membrane protein assembly factor BamD
MTRTERWTPAILLVLAGGCAAGNLPRMDEQGDRVGAARVYRERGRCDLVIQLLSSYVITGAGSADVDEATYLLGDCYLETRQFELAAPEFERLLRDYPESDSAGGAAFRLGDAFWGQSRAYPFDQEMTIKALGQWQGYLSAYPGHWANGAARMRIARARERLAEKAYRNGELYVKLKQWRPARAYFQQVIREFPDTSFAAEAALELAHVAVREGDLDHALRQLQRVSLEYPGTAAAQRAERERARLERMIGRDRPPADS